MSQAADAIATIRRHMKLHVKPVAKSAAKPRRGRRAAARPATATADRRGGSWRSPKRLESVVLEFASRIGQPPMVAEDLSVLVRVGEPIYCASCCTPILPARVRNPSRPWFGQLFRCGFVLFLCYGCRRRIKKTGREFDRVMDTHGKWHVISNLAGGIRWGFEQGGPSIGMGSMVN